MGNPIGLTFVYADNGGALYVPPPVVGASANGSWNGSRTQAFSSLSNVYPSGQVGSVVAGGVTGVVGPSLSEPSLRDGVFINYGEQTRCFC